MPLLGTYEVLVTTESALTQGLILSSPPQPWGMVLPPFYRGARAEIWEELNDSARTPCLHSCLPSDSTMTLSTVYPTPNFRVCHRASFGRLALSRSSLE